MNYLLIGNTGVGKSYLVESLTGRPGLVGSSVDSTTVKCTEYALGDGSTVIDTPGLADTKGRSRSILQQITQVVSEQKACVPIIVLDFHQRLTKETEIALKALTVTLHLNTSHYLLCVNKVQASRRGPPVEAKCAELATAVTTIVGHQPAASIGVLFDGDLSSKQLRDFPLVPLGEVSLFEDFVRSTRSIESKVAYLRACKDRYDSHDTLSFAKEFTLPMYKTQMKTSIGMAGAGVFLLATPAAPLGLAMMAAGYFNAVASSAVLGAMAIGEVAYDSVVLAKNKLSEEDKEFLKANEQFAKLLLQQLEEVLAYYN